MSKLQEDVISLVEFKSPTRFNPRPRSNRVGSPSVQSTSSRSHDEIANLFSVKTDATHKKFDKQVSDDLESLPTTELSDDVFVDSVPQRTKSYRDKIRERFNVVKSKAGTTNIRVGSKSGSREKLLVQRMRKESGDLDAEIESVRQRFSLNKRTYSETRFFSDQKSPQKKTGEEGKDEQDEEKSEDLIFGQIGEQYETHLNESYEKNIFVPTSKPLEIIRKLADEEPRYLEEEGLFKCQRKNVTKSHINLLEQRLLSVEDKKWFNCEGELILQESPLLNTSLREKKFIDDPNIATFTLPSSNIDCTEVVTIADYNLEVILDKLEFEHHPLFSLEHVFEKRLKKLYNDYKTITENNSLSRVLRKIDAIRQIKRNLAKIEGENLTQISKHTQEIKELRNLAYEEGKAARNNIRAILQTWKAIKKIREVKGHSNTSIKLSIKKESVDRDAEQAALDKQIDTTVKELVDELKHDYEKQLLTYKKELQRWKDEEKLDDITTDEDPPKKPIYNVDEETLKSDIKRQFDECFKAPGEPILNFFLSDRHEITKDVTDGREKIRRTAVNTTKVYLRVLCNKIEVCKTEPVALNERFQLKLGEAFNIELRSVPRQLTVEIIEQPKKLHKRKVCEVNLDIPDRDNFRDRFATQHFDRQELIHYKHEGVGSGLKLSDTLGDFNFNLTLNETINTSGTLTYTVRRAHLHPTTEDFNSFDEVLHDVIDKNGTIDVEKLTHWVTTTSPDPQDPRNSILYEYITGIDTEVSYRKGKTFRLSPHMRDFQFCDPKELEDNLRLTVLQLRNQHEIEFDGMLIPNRVKEIPFNILADYKKRIATEDRISYEDDDDADYERQRINSKKYLRQIHNKIFQKCKSSDCNLLYENVVNEKYLPYFEQTVKVLISNFFNWFRWKPEMPQPLPRAIGHNVKTDVKERSVQYTEQVNIIFKIGSGFNFKLKSNNNVEKHARPFLIITHNDLQVNSSISLGETPMWNEIISIPVESTHIDYLNPNSLKGIITINVYNSETEDLENGEYNWLGFIDVPLAAVCCNNNLSGRFKITEPHIFQDIDHEKDKLKSKSSKTAKAPPDFKYIDMTITLEPPIPKLTPNMGDLASNDAPYMQDHILKWNEMYNTNFPQRKFSAFAIDVHNRTNCITKYLKPLEPPRISETLDFEADQCARFVSLIPFTDCNQFYNNVWLTTEELLSVSLGSMVDHAVALTCYLMALKMDAWLLLGFGVPHGSTAYVLVREYQQDVPVFYIYDVSCCEKYFITDEKCPLQKIYSVANENNVWGNIQRGDNIQLTRFDFNKRSDWLPLFSGEMLAPTNSVNFKVEYKPKFGVEYLEMHIEKKIKKRISKLRTLNRTIWRHNTSHSIKQILKTLELTTMFDKHSSDVLSEILPALSDQKVNGFILNIPYSEIGTILKIVENSKIHVQKDRNIEFAVTVYIHCYPGQVLSIWLCVISFDNT